MRVVIVSSNPNIDIVNGNNYIIGVDHWCLDLIKNGIKMDVAIGDFDFLTSDEKKLIKDNCKEYIELSPIKDATDSLAAVRKALEVSVDILIVGGIKGKRIEHFLGNLMLVNTYGVKMVDDDTLIYKLTTGEYTFYKDEYKYISFFTLDEAELTLEGFKYPLNKYNLFPSDPLCISNEVEEKGKMILKGSIIVIKSKNDA